MVLERTVYAAWRTPYDRCCNLSGGVALIVWFTTNGMCAKNKNICKWREQAIIEWSLLLLAATVRSFAHMPLGISDRNSGLISQVFWLFTTRHMQCPVTTHETNGHRKHNSSCVFSISFLRSTTKNSQRISNQSFMRPSAFINRCR